MQVATLLADGPTFAGLGRGVLVLGALWWAWTAYASLTNTLAQGEVVGVAQLVALGQAFVSIGIGVTGIDIGPGEVVAAVLGLLVATAFWLAYFDFFSIRGERMLHDLEGAERVAFERDVYAYAHFPMIVGIVLFAFAMRNVIGHVDDELEAAAAVALCGGSGFDERRTRASNNRAPRSPISSVPEAFPTTSRRVPVGRRCAVPLRARVNGRPSACPWREAALIRSTAIVP